MDKNTARRKIQALVEKYEQIKLSGKINNYSEQDTKDSFIRPLFESLGWDFDNRDEVTKEEDISGDRVDYGIYLNGQPKFFIEAKKLRANLNDPKHAEQAIKYCFNRVVTWAVLTDFESLKVFNAQNVSENLSNKLYFEIGFSEYVERFDQLWQLSKESFQIDLIEKEAMRVGKLEQKITVTEQLAKDLNEIRDLLSSSLHQWNDHVSASDLDEGVQKLLDRLIFLRVAEDRKIEEPILKQLLRDYDNKRKAGQKIELYESMSAKFRELDAIYNSKLFSPHPFEKWEEYGKATEKAIDILYGKSGYYEYDFKFIPSDVLGQVYESYLGHLLSKSRKGLTLDVSAKKRKEQGIYYTPSYIEDYIVEQTLKPILDKCNSISDLKSIKVLDPACGSGSFLIKAMEIIEKKYVEFGSRKGEGTRIQILLDNIYGVDLDQKAVEIARLNLVINSLESRMKLPGLEEHIKNGNSLISGTDQELKKYFGNNFRDKKAFNWREEFPEVFSRTNPGFDAIIGNPPYVNIANIDDDKERNYLAESYVTAKNKSDLYSFFTEKAITITRSSGLIGLIFSNSWLGTDSFSKFRKYLVENTTIKNLVKLPSDVFKQASVTTIIIVMEKKKTTEDHSIELLAYENGRYNLLPHKLTYKRILGNYNNTISFDPEIRINTKVVTLESLAKFSLGIKTSNDKRFILSEKKDENTYKALRGKDISRYSSKWNDKWMWYRPELMMEKKGAGPRKIEIFEKQKIVVKDVAVNISATIDSEKYLTTDTLNLIYDIKKYDPRYILAILNSNFINIWLKTHFPAGLHIKINQLKHIPIPELDLKDDKVKIIYNSIISGVSEILKVNREILIRQENSNRWTELTNTAKKIDSQINGSINTLFELLK